MIAFDSDVLIYAASNDHPFRAEIRSLTAGESGMRRVGSVLLLPEVLSKPVRRGVDTGEVRALQAILDRLELYPLDEPTARLATILAARYGLRAADATHLATAVVAGADAFLTNNRRDFSTSIAEIDIIYPDELPRGASSS